MSRLVFMTIVTLQIISTTRGFSKDVVHWSGGNNFDWPSPTTKTIYKSSGRFLAKNVVATRAAIYKDTVFLALPRYKSGVPATLAKINLSKGKNHLGYLQQSTLSPFPSWSVQEVNSCSSFQSIVDLFLDPLSILWVLDTGVINVLERPINTCAPKIVAINAKTGKLVKSIDVSPLSSPSSRLQFLVVDYSSDGRVFAYVSDAANRAILVFEVLSGQGYRLILPEVVSNKLDVLYLNLIRRSSGNVLIISYLDGNNVYSIKTEHLQNGTAHGQLRDLGIKSDKIVFLGTDTTGAVYYRKVTEPDVYKWSDFLDNADSTEVQLVHRGNPFSLPSQVVQDFKRGRMRVLESNFPDFLGGTVGQGVNHTLSVF